MSLKYISPGRSAEMDHNLCHNNYQLPKLYSYASLNFAREILWRQFFFICDIDVSNVSLTNLYEKVSLINLAYHLNFCALSNDIAYL